MIFSTSGHEELIFNNARQKAFCCLKKTLHELYETDVTERDFANRWLKHIAEEKDLFTEGWYCPPAHGMAVLCDERVNFDSLRNSQYELSDRLIDWKEGHLYVYCSPVDRISGYIGDLSVTLYFGQDERIKAHFRNCRAALQDIFDYLEDVQDPAELYMHSLKVFEKRGLRSNVVSKTDPSPSNLGHSFTCLNAYKDRKKLTTQDVNQLSSSRKFINSGAEWLFKNGDQFTIEPQLLSIKDPSLYKVTHHYVVKKCEAGFVVCCDIDSLLNEFQLI